MTAIAFSPSHPWAFTPDEVAATLAAGGERQPDPAHSGRPTGSLDGMAGEWVYDRTRAVALQVAVAAFGMAPEQFGNWSYGKVLEYPAGMGGIDWHADNAVDREPLERALLVASGDMEPWHFEEMEGRTVSVMVQLSDDAEYDGGDLQLRNGAEQFSAPRDLGSVLVARADTEHRVLPVSTGTRLSLVVFFGWSPRGENRSH